MKPTKRAGVLRWAFICATAAMIVAGLFAYLTLKKPQNNNADEYSESPPIEQNNSKTEESADGSDSTDEPTPPLLDLKIFNKTTLNSTKKILGNPKSQTVEKPHLASYVEWDTGTYNAVVPYTNGEEILYGALIVFKEISCENDPTLENVKTVTELIGLDFARGNWSQKTQAGSKSFTSDSYDGWELLEVRCGDGFVDINAMPEGYSKWSGLKL